MAKRPVTHRMIEAFRAAMLHGGISAGADALGIPQPSMSRLIADLQKVVGFPLFQKSGRSVKPTDEAIVLMTKVQQSFVGLEEITSFSTQLQKQMTGRLSICTIPSIGHSVMPEIIEHLSAAWTLAPGDLIFTGTPEGVAAVPVTMTSYSPELASARLVLPQYLHQFEDQTIKLLQR